MTEDERAHEAPKAMQSRVYVGMVDDSSSSDDSGSHEGKAWMHTEHYVMTGEESEPDWDGVENEDRTVTSASDSIEETKNGHHRGTE